MVILICGDQRLEASERFAQSILQIQNQMKQGSWELPKDSPYLFTDNALIKRTGTEDCKGKARPKRDRPGKAAPGKATLSHGDDAR